MRARHLKSVVLGVLLSATLLGSLAPRADAATIIIVNNDAAGEGFNDPTPRAPVGGNPGTTLGDQRLYVFQYAANIWGSILPSNVTIVVRAQFAAQTCTATSAVLGSAGADHHPSRLRRRAVPGHLVPRRRSRTSWPAPTCRRATPTSTRPST